MIPSALGCHTGAAVLGKRKAFHVRIAASVRASDRCADRVQWRFTVFALVVQQLLDTGHPSFHARCQSGAPAAHGPPVLVITN